MHNPPIVETLLEIGLSENEAKVYFAVLSLGSSTVLKIAEAAEIKRTTVYSVLESLVRQGLVIIEMNGFKRRFIAESPEKLHRILDSRRDSLRTALPEFMALYNLKGGESFIRYYQGLESVKSIYDGLLKDIRSGDSYCVVSDMHQWLQLDKDYFLNFIERRAKLPISIRLLLADSETSRHFQKFQKNYNETVRLLPPRTALAVNMVITPQRLVIHQLIPPIIAIVIENRSVINMHQQIFELLWSSMTH